MVLGEKRAARVAGYLESAGVGRTRMKLTSRGELDASTALLLESFARRADSAATPDGLNLTPADTARMLEAKLIESKREDLLAELQAALAKLDPKLLELPTSEQRLGPARGPGVRGGR